MALDKALNHLKKYNLDDKVIILEESSATVKEAAHALNTSEAQIAKTLSFMVDNKPILIITSGNKKIDNSKFKSEFNEKAHMIPAENVEKLIGHSVGGVCPFGINENIEVYLDISLKDFGIIYPAAGTSNSAVKLTISELEKASQYKKWINVTKE